MIKSRVVVNHSPGRAVGKNKEQDENRTEDKPGKSLLRGKHHQTYRFCKRLPVDQNNQRTENAQNQVRRQSHTRKQTEKLRVNRHADKSAHKIGIRIQGTIRKVPRDDTQHTISNYKCSYTNVKPNNNY